MAETSTFQTTLPEKLQYKSGMQIHTQKQNLKLQVIAFLQPLEYGFNGMKLLNLHMTFDFLVLSFFKAHRSLHQIQRSYETNQPICAHCRQQRNLKQLDQETFIQFHSTNQSIIPQPQANLGRLKESSESILFDSAYLIPILHNLSFKTNEGGALMQQEVTGLSRRNGFLRKCKLRPST